MSADTDRPPGTARTDLTDHEGEAPAGPRWGWWLLPLFVAVGLAGAVLAAALVTVVQSQRIDALREETASARADLADAVEQVESAAGDALATIGEEVAAVRDGLSTDLPLDDAAEAGIVHLRAEVPAAAPPAPAPPASAPPEAPGGPTDPDAPDGPTPDAGGAADTGTADAAQTPPTDPPPSTLRAASGFVVARDGDTTFLVTTFALLADPEAGDRPLDRPVEVRSAAGDATARVHSWDADADLLVLRVDAGGGLAPLAWRPADRPLQAGDRIVAVGVTPTLAAVQVGGTVAAVTEPGLVSDVPALELLAGGPVVDADGEVVAMSSRRAAPFGDDPVAVPIRALCGELLARCPD